jgi:oligoendopeptidase F
MSAGEVQERSAVPEAERWNDQSVFADPAAWEAAYRGAEQLLEACSAFAGSLGDGPARLADWFELSDRAIASVGKLRVYANMAYSVDSLDREAQDRNERSRGLIAAFSSATAFERPELLALGLDTLRAWMEIEPRLAGYGHAFDLLERAAVHVRSSEVEALLGGLAGPFASATQAHGVLANNEIDFGRAVAGDGEHYDITQGSIGSLLASSDRELRRSAFERYADAHIAVRGTMATVLGTGIRQNTFMARARHYDSALHAAMEPLGLPVAVFHNLLDTFRAQLPTWHRYWRAKRRMLGLDAFHPYDIKAALSAERPTVTYGQAIDWLGEAMAPLGDDYVTTMRHGALDGRWVDRSINRGKRMGAFSSGVQGTQPFIMMSYAEDVLGMSTLAHELGHSLHSYLSWQHQPQVYASYTLFAAEVASNLNQAMLRAHLSERFADDRAMQIALIEEAMANFYRYFFVMPTLARFELEIHQRADRGEALSADLFDGLMADLFAEGYGDEVVMDRPRVGNTWAQFHTHLYSRFYVYQYATGISGAHALARGILDGEEGAAERYLTFLKAGGSKDPLDALAEAGVDLRSPEPVEQTFAVLGELVDRLEALAE